MRASRGAGLISRKALREFTDLPSGAETPLDDTWTNLVNVRRTYRFTVFNIGGNKYRLATFVNCRTATIFIRHVMTHNEYSKQDWRMR